MSLRHTLIIVIKLFTMLRKCLSDLYFSKDAKDVFYHKEINKNKNLYVPDS
ncbi:hypothetical protein MCW_01513 [Cardidatus Bartonella washoeensis 085-0475]|uniref:Uncharacterized protein n=1 Tax=Cardidatus Bartonella washoeensis 085-0475 TaxID=1094564 RepID=J0QJU4_9HYPH|nr:hypothetical protein MCW_01513 [Bartonella washoeensis 085-0475]